MRLSACYVVKKWLRLPLMNSLSVYEVLTLPLPKLHVSVRSRHVWRRRMKDLVSGTLTSYTEYSKLMPSCGPSSPLV